MGLSSLFRNRFSRSAKAFNARRVRKPSSASGLRPEHLERRTVLATDVLMVTSPNANGAYNAGDQVIIQVEFARPVTITSPSSFLQLRLNTGNYATFTGQSGGGATLNFRYDVRGPVAGLGGDNTPDLDVLNGAALVNATFSDADGAFVPVLPVGTGVTNSLAFVKDIVIDTTKPATPVVNELRVNPIIEQTNPGYAQVHPDYFTLIGTAGTGPLGADETLTVSVNGCTYVLTPGSVGAPDATGVWRVNLLQAPTSGGPLSPWSTTAIQQYQVEAVFTDAAGNASVGRGFVIIDMEGPTVENVTAANPNGAYTVGETIDVEVWFLEPVEVVGAPQLALGLDVVGTGPGAGTAGRVWADYDPAKSGGNLVVFSYTIQIGDTDGDLEYEIVGTPPSAITLNGGMIQDAAGNPATLTMPAVGAAGSLGFNKDIVIDTTAPGSPTITRVIDDVPPVFAALPATTDNIPTGGVTNDPILRIEGTAPTTAPLAAQEVEIFINGVSAGTVPVTAPDAVTGANWAFTTPLLADGTYTFSAIAIDSAGNRSLASNNWVVRVDTTAPAAPVISSVNDNVALITGIVADGGVTNDTTLLLRGTAEPGATVKIYANGAPYSTNPPLVAGANPVHVQAGLGGIWEYTTTALANGTYAFTATATDEPGNTGPLSASYTVTVDTLAPTVTITRIGSGTLKIGDTATITFTLSEPSTTFTDADVTVTNGTLSPLVGSGDTYTATFTPAASLDAGTNATISVAAGVFSDAAGNVSTAAATLTIPLDTRAPNAPVITGIDDNVDASGFPMVPPENVVNGGITNDALLVIRGTAEANSVVQVFQDGALLGIATLVGTTWTIPTGALANGVTYAFTAKTTDAAGNESALSVPPYSVTVDTTAPTAPEITAFNDDFLPGVGVIPSGGSSNDNTPTLSGTRSLDTVDIEIYNGATRILGDLTLPTATTWAFRPAVALADGLYDFRAMARDGATANRSLFSLPYSVTIDTTAAPPAIAAVEDDFPPQTGNVANEAINLAHSFTNDQTLKISVAAEAGTASVELYYDVAGIAVLIGYPLLNPATNFWELTTAPLAEGRYSFKACVVDALGNRSPYSPLYTVTVDISAPVTSTTITTALDDNPLPATNIPNGGATNDATPELRGKAEPFATVTVNESGVPFGQTTADANGDWSLQTGPLGDGTYSFTAIATDRAGNMGIVSLPPYVITVDLTPPVAPSIDGVADDVPLVIGNVVDGGVTNDTTLVLTGTTAAGTTVKVYDGVAVLGPATLTSSSSWTFTTGALAVGLHSFRVEATDTAGNTSLSPVYSVTIDTAAPTATITRTGSGTLKLGDTATITFTLSEPSTNFTDVDVTVTNGTLSPLVGSGNTYTATFTPTAGLDAGSNATISVAAGVFSDAAGNVNTAATPLTIPLDTKAPIAPVITRIDDDVAPVTGLVGPGGSTNDSTPMLTGTAEPGSTVRVRIDGTLLPGSVVANGVGGWNYTVTPGLADGTYTFTAEATDAVGNTGAVSAAYTVTIDTAAPTTPPSIISIVDNVGSITGPLADGAATDDTELVLTGTAVAGVVNVVIYDNGMAIGQAAVSGGTWTFLATGLAEGPHAFTATAADAAGNESAESASRSVMVDITPPGPPVITQAVDNFGKVQGKVVNKAATDDTTPTVSGSTDGDTAKLEIYRNGVLVSTMTMTPTDILTKPWSYTSPALAVGTYTFTAKAYDAAGNGSAESSPPYTVTVVGPITASSPTFPASPIRPVPVPITSFAVVFNQPVTGFAVSNLKLFLGSRPVDIRGATVTRSATVTDGTTWVVSLPLKSINAKGNYRLDITGANIVSLLTGASMTGVSSLFWKRI